MCAWPCGQRPDLGAAGDPGVQRHSAAFGREAEVLWPLLVLRTAVLIVSGAQQAALDPDNDYVTEQSDGEWRMFEQAISVPMDVMTAVIKADLGLARAPAAVDVATPLVDAASVVTLDLSTTSDAYDDGRWLTTDVEDVQARAAVDDGAELAVTAYGQPRLNRAPKLSHDSPAVVPTGIGMWPASDTALLAPWDGEVVDASADAVTFRGGGLRADAVRCAGGGHGQPAGRRDARGGTGPPVGAAWSSDRSARPWHRCSRPRSWRRAGLR